MEEAYQVFTILHRLLKQIVKVNFLFFYFLFFFYKNVIINEKDTPLRFAKLGFNISAPHMYATCFDALQIEEGNTFLDIGSGCGHMTCVCYFSNNSFSLSLCMFIHTSYFLLVGWLCSWSCMVKKNLYFTKRNIYAYLNKQQGTSHGLDIRQDIVDFGESNKKRFEEKSGIDLSNVTFEVRNCFIDDPDGRCFDRIVS